jgi:hypothetical protein
MKPSDVDEDRELSPEEVKLIMSSVKGLMKWLDRGLGNRVIFTKFLRRMLKEEDETLSAEERADCELALARNEECRVVIEARDRVFALDDEVRLMERQRSVHMRDIIRAKNDLKEIVAETVFSTSEWYARYLKHVEELEKRLDVLEQKNG